MLIVGKCSPLTFAVMIGNDIAILVATSEKQLMLGYGTAFSFPIK